MSNDTKSCESKSQSEAFELWIESVDGFESRNLTLQDAFIAGSELVTNDLITSQSNLVKFLQQSIMDKRDTINSMGESIKSLEATLQEAVEIISRFYKCNDDSAGFGCCSYENRYIAEQWLAKQEYNKNER